MIRMFAMCAILLTVSRATAQRTPVPAPQPPRPVRDASVRMAAAAGSDATKRAADYDRLEQKIAERDRLQTEIEELRKSTRTPQQILVRVQVFEISLTKMRRQGIDFVSENKGVWECFHQLTEPVAGEILRSDIIVQDRPDVQEFLGVLTKNNIGRVLAEPAIVVVSGRPGSFNVGGELPVPAAPGSKQIVEFLKFGTQVDVVAQARSSNLVRLELRVRVAEPDYSHSIMVAETRVPTLKVKQCDTAVELAFGQSAVLTGMVERRTEAIQTEAGIKEELNDIALMFIATPENVGTLAPLPGG